MIHFFFPEFLIAQPNLNRSHTTIGKSSTTIFSSCDTSQFDTNIHNNNKKNITSFYRNRLKSTEQNKIKIK